MSPTSERAEDVQPSDDVPTSDDIPASDPASHSSSSSGAMTLAVGDDIIASLIEEFAADHGLDDPNDVEVEHPTGQGSAEAVRRQPFHERHRLASLVACTLGLLITVAGWSYVESVTAPGKTDTIGIRSVEWLRDIHMGWFVNSVERWWYTSFGKPDEGGTPDRDIEIAGAHADRPDTRSDDTTVDTDATAAPDHLAPPETMSTPAPEPMPGEGEWLPIGPMIGGIPGIYATQTRPDAVHTSILGLVVWMDPRLVRFQLHPGSTEPGGNWTMPPFIPEDQRDTLISAFNSGFKLNESMGGFYTDGREAIPLRDGQATIVIRTDGTMEVGQWGRDFQMGPDIASARQNLALIVDGGAPVPGIENDAGGRWGNTLGGDVLVWRSGVGQTADGAIVYVASDGLTAASLADLLVRAGAVRAMELDINHAWTQYNMYSRDEAGSVTGTKGLPDMMKSGDRYLTTESRDFISVHAREF